MDAIYDSHDADEPLTLRRLYPTFSEQELVEAREHLDECVDVVLRIYARIRADPEGSA